jgi:hypothetical protein
MGRCLPARIDVGAPQAGGDGGLQFQLMARRAARIADEVAVEQVQPGRSLLQADIVLQAPGVIERDLELVARDRLAVPPRRRIGRTEGGRVIQPPADALLIARVEVDRAIIDGGQVAIRVAGEGVGKGGIRLGRRRRDVEDRIAVVLDRIFGRKLEIGERRDLRADIRRSIATKATSRPISICRSPPRDRRSAS